eukprot:CAMPEP_0184398176 /NCGR_PEP_ID=MMETSP0007-20130409/64446_1 /TAXON_ID=97485 /ORGANISM="Prymnesium parvum, Strain Texoma1" /LENGTH=45 /DNA_ID= /DNA_START= /DNA_END= /DNA_ORIENTATION=
MAPGSDAREGRSATLAKEGRGSGTRGSRRAVGCAFDCRRAGERAI